MDATARDSNVIQPADTNGLEELFDVESAKAMPGNSQGTTLELEGCSLGIAQWLTVEEASKRLEISPNAVIKRLGKGKLAGRKVPGQFGEKWLVDPAAVPQELHVEFAATQTEESPQAVPGNSKGTASNGQEQPGFDRGIAQKSLDILGEVIKQQSEQIRLQNEFIKHLSEQNQQKDLQLKLLADIQNKPTAWTKFKTWFLGSP